MRKLKKKRDKTGGKDFKVGNPGGPGRPKLPEDLKQARKEQAADIEAIFYKYLDSTEGELKKAFEDQSTTAKHLIVIQLMIKSIELADEKRFNFILDRTIGKVVEKIDHTVEAKPSIMVRRDGTEYVFSNKPKENK